MDFPEILYFMKCVIHTMRFTIFGRLLLGYIAIMVLVIFQGTYTTLKVNRLHQLVSTIDKVDGAAIRVAEHLSDELFEQIGFEKKFLISNDPDFQKQFLKTTQYIKEKLNELESLAHNRETQQLILFSKYLYTRYIALFNEEVGFITNNAAYTAATYRDEKNRITDKLADNLKQIIQHSRLSRNQKINKSSQISFKVLRFTASLAVLIILTGVSISFFNTRSINRPISLLKKKTREISKGNFDIGCPIDSPPEIAELNNDFNLMCYRLKELEQMKIDLVSHVSHELRTPLTIIKESSSMLMEGIYSNNAEKQHELSSIINEECNRMTNSVNRILDLSRMEAGMMPFYFTECELDPLIKKMALKIDPILKRKKMSLNYTLADSVPPVKIDERQVEQVMENLLGNALKYTPEKGKIGIDVSMYYNEKAYAKVSISDNGNGIAKDDLQKIFDKFQRIENGKETVRGTGLGLTIAKHIVSSHGGKIWVESTEGKGSTFYFTLPAYLLD